MIVSAQRSRLAARRGDMIAQDGGRDGSSALLDGPSNEPSPDKMFASAMPLRITRKAARRRPPAGPMTMRPGTTAETSDGAQAAPLVERMKAKRAPTCLRQSRRRSREPAASLPDADLIQMTPVAAAARCSVLFVAAPEIETPDRTGPAYSPSPREAARRRDEDQEAATTRTKSDLKFFVFLVRLTHWRSAASRAGTRLMRTLNAARRLQRPVSRYFRTKPRCAADTRGGRAGTP